MTVDPKLYQLLFETFKGELEEQHQVMVDALLSLERARSRKKIEELVSLLFRVSHNLKGAAKSVERDDIATLAHQLEDTFSLWRDKQTKPQKEQINACLKGADKMLAALKASEKNMSSLMFVQDEMIQVPLSRVERVNAKLGEFIIFQLRMANWVKCMTHIQAMLSQVKGDTAKALSLIQQEVTYVMGEAESVSREFARSLSILQADARSMRLLPISRVLSPLERTAREAADDLDKQVELEVSGGDVELDKSILDALKSPLQHVVRNAIAHGIETTAFRQKHHKPVPATLKIYVLNEAGELKIRLIDDGQGLNLERIKQGALEKKLHSKKELDSFSPQEIYSLIFCSGLSTAETVSELSGRGVGLDAVLADIQRIKGRIEVDSVEQEGCTFTLTLPLALASSRGLFVKLGEMTLMLPTLSLHALYDVNCNTLLRVDNQWVKLINNKPVVVASLFELLGLGEQAWDRIRSYEGILICHDGREVLLLVDEVIEERECVVKPLPFPLDELHHLTGATLTGHGMLVLVLDVEYILGKACSNQISALHMQGASTLAEPNLKKIMRVLVVDDALTTRALTINALKAAGYQTLYAEDGQKAWNLLQKNKVDCVVTDIEMPHMNGFELTQAIKTNEALASLPVVIVSSLEKQEDKKRGMDVGASAYLVKRDFDTRVLIEMVASLL